MNERTDRDRLNELESRQAFQEETIASLNEALISQQQRIAQVEKMLELMVERFRQSASDVDLPSDEPPPPHY